MNIPRHILQNFVFAIVNFEAWAGDGYNANKATDIYLFNTHILADTEVDSGADWCNFFKRLIDDCLK